MSSKFKKETKEKVRAFSRALGFEPELDLNVTRIYQTRFFKIEKPCHYLQIPADPYTTPFEIEIETATTRTGFSFANEGWHPFVETLKDYLKKPNLSYEESTLKRLYDQYIPQNYFECLFYPQEHPLKPLAEWPRHAQLLADIWLIDQRRLQNVLNRLQNHKGLGNCFYGPHTSRYGDKELNRLLRLFDSINNYGYQDTDKNEFINGYFLEKDNQIRFVLLEGNHRVSVLKCLGYKQVKVVIQKGHPTVIRFQELKYWINRQKIIYDLPTAEKIFNYLFYSNGICKATRLNLLKQHLQAEK